MFILFFMFVYILFTPIYEHIAKHIFFKISGYFRLYF